MGERLCGHLTVGERLCGHLIPCTETGGGGAASAPLSEESKVIFNKLYGHLYLMSLEDSASYLG